LAGGARPFSPPKHVPEGVGHPKICKRKKRLKINKPQRSQAELGSRPRKKGLDLRGWHHAARRLWVAGPRRCVQIAPPLRGLPGRHRQHGPGQQEAAEGGRQSSDWRGAPFLARRLVDCCVAVRTPERGALHCTSTAMLGVRWANPGSTGQATQGGGKRPSVE
jgi:hypothetical protein